MKTIRTALWISLFLASAVPAGAVEGLSKGSSILALQLTEGTGDFVTAEGGTGFIAAYDHSELGVQAQYWNLVSEHWAFTLAAGIGFFRETDEPGSNAAPGAEDFEYEQSSWQVRVGFDRFVHLSPEVHLFVGPGLQYWSGEQDRGPSSAQVESESTNRIALSGRLGAHVALSDSFGLTGQLGHYLGHATAEDATAKASWWPSGFQGAVGFAFDF